LAKTRNERQHRAHQHEDQTGEEQCKVVNSAVAVKHSREQKHGQRERDDQGFVDGAHVNLFRVSISVILIQIEV
jgi:hypothetical protein